MNQHINIEDYLEPTDPPLPLPAIETFKGTNTLDSTETLGETTITQGYQVPLDIRNLSDTNEINEKCDYHTDGDGATIELNEKTGTITINGTTGDTGARVWIVPDRLHGSYWYSGVPQSQDIAYAKLVPLSSAPYYNKWDGTPPDPSTDFDYGDGAEALCDISLANYPQYILYFAPNYTFNNFVVKPKIQKATITDTKNIYVGSSPLGEGEMVSRESTNLDITLERGQSVFETTLTNKPEMIITPDSYDKIKDMLLNTKHYDYNETQTDYITDDVTEVTQ